MSAAATRQETTARRGDSGKHREIYTASVTVAEDRNATEKATMLWLKALHIIFVVCWFAGPFLPAAHLCVLRCQRASRQARTAGRDGQQAVPFRHAHSCLSAICSRAGMIALNPDYYLEAGWMWLKLGGVAFLVAYHVQCGRYVRQPSTATTAMPHGHVFYRFLQ